MQRQFKKPVPVGCTSYPTSDAELETWVEQTVQREIVRGRILQDQKSLLSERLNNTAVFGKPPRLAGQSSNRRSSIPVWTSKRLRSKSPIARNAESRNSREESCSSYKSSRLGRPACSMRISELAAPTKRQCVSSWKANANVLPATMVERLKQRVMDQEPIVKVSDAVNCMKNKKLPPDTRNNVVVTPAKRPSRKINKEAMKTRIQAEYKILSDLFGMKIAQLLMKPVAITLNSQLQKLTNVISEEINNVIKDTKLFNTDRVTNKRMVQEISEKVTIWIAKILEDSSEKLLEEDLKARAIPTGELITLIQIITYKETDLEEQEGPALDVIDDMVDSILHKCVRTPSGNVSPEYLSVSSVDVDKDGAVDTDRPTNDDDEASQGDVVTVDEVANIDTIENDIINQINNIIDSIKNEHKKDTIQNDIINQLNKVIDSIKYEHTTDTSHEDFEYPSLTYTTNTYQQNDENKDKSDFESKLDIKPGSDTNPEPDIQPESDVTTEPDIKAESDIQPESDMTPEPSIKAESDIQPESDMTPEPSIKAESDIQPESDIIGESGTTPEPDIKAESDTKPEPDIDVLYSNDTPLVFPGEYNDDEVDEHNTNEGIIDIPESNAMLLPSAYEMTELTVMQNQDMGDENIFLEPEENNLLDTNEEQTSNVSAAIELIPGEFSEEKIKKVQFSKENLDPMNQKEQINQIIREIKQFEDEQLLENIPDFEKPHIDFAPPNDELLSDADESWPEKVPITKPSASVTRSISSMGKLLESDEINYTVFEDSTEHSPQTTDYDKHHDYGYEEKYLDNTLNPKVIDDLKENKTLNLQEMGDLQNTTEDLPHQIEIHEKVIHGGPLTEQETENVNVISSLELAQDASVTVLRKDESVILIGDEELKVSQDITEPESITTLSELLKYDNIVSMRGKDISEFDQSKSATHTEEGTTKGQKRQGYSDAKFTSQKFDYRVHLNTAPAWIRRGQGEPNGGPCACRQFRYTGTNRMKERELEMRKWCSDLDFILMNLDKWKNWLNYISKYITDLKRKAGKMGGQQMRSRSPPETGEGTSWRTLNKRAKGGLEMHRQDETVKFKIPSAPVKYCVRCGRTKPNQLKRRHHRSYLRNNTESLCKRHHHKREI